MALFKLAKDLKPGDIVGPSIVNEVYGQVKEIKPAQYDVMWVHSELDGKVGRYLLFKEGNVQFFGNVLEKAS